METGWSAADGSMVSQATTDCTESHVTRSGVAFARFLRSLGVQGPFELVPTRSSAGVANRRGAKRRIPRGDDTGRPGVSISLPSAAA